MWPSQGTAWRRPVLRGACSIHSRKGVPYKGRVLVAGEPGLLLEGRASGWCGESLVSVWYPSHRVPASASWDPSPSSVPPLPQAETQPFLCPVLSCSHPQCLN
jgi:hypothetical protein